MQKVKEGYRASVRLNMNHSEQREVYEMFEAIMQTGDYVNESDVFRDAIRKLYDFKFHKEQEQTRMQECEQCAELVCERVQSVIEELLNNHLIAISSGERTESKKKYENQGKVAPEETQELPVGLCDFMSLL